MFPSPPRPPRQHVLPPVDLDSPAVVAQFERDFIAHLVHAEPVEGVIRPANAWSVMSALQLALSHPTFPAAIRPTVAAFARQLQEIVSRTPTLAAVAEAGWHRENDYTPDGQRVGKSEDVQHAQGDAAPADPLRVPGERSGGAGP